MTETRFWLIRHAIVDENARAMLYGIMDVPLCEWAASDEKYAKLLDLVDKTARYPEQIASAEHVLVVARTSMRPAASRGR